MLKPILDAVPHCDQDVFFRDDFLFGATNSIEASNIEKALILGLKTNPVGPLYLKEHQITDLNKGCDYLGYHVGIRPLVFGGQFCIRPTNASFWKFSKKLLQKCLDAPDGLVDEIGCEYIGQWYASFRLWELQEREEYWFIPKCNDIIDTVKFAKTMNGKNLKVEDFEWRNDGLQYMQIKEA